VHQHGAVRPRLKQRLQTPVYDIYSFVNWFHAGLSPRGFGLPGDPL